MIRLFPDEDMNTDTTRQKMLLALMSGLLVVVSAVAVFAVVYSLMQNAEKDADNRAFDKRCRDHGGVPWHEAGGRICYQTHGLVKLIGGEK